MSATTKMGGSMSGAMVFLEGVDPLQQALNDAGSQFELKRQAARARDERHALIVAGIHAALDPLLDRISALPLRHTRVPQTIGQAMQREQGIKRRNGAAVSFYRGESLHLVINVLDQSIIVTQATTLYPSGAPAGEVFPIDTPPSVIVAAFCKLIASHVDYEALKGAGK